MAYLGKGPEQVLSGVASKSTFTGDGSTTTFDISTDIPAGGENDIQVFVDNVRQEPGSGASYTVGVDGSGNLRRITFNTAPEASQSIYVINPRRIEAVGAIPDNTVTTSKVQDLAVSTGKIAADAITEAKIADDAISEEHLDVTSITGHTELSETANDSDVLLIYDASAGALKKVLRSNLVLQAPTFSSISPTNVNTGDGTGNATFTITGTEFSTGTTAKLLTSSGSDVAFDSVTRDSATQLTCVIAISSLSNANEPYGVQVLGGTGLNTAVQSGQVNINAQPVFTTTAGSLGSDRISMSSVSVNATDPESAGNVTFELQSGSLPPGISITNTAAEGGTATFSGTFSSLPSSDTAYNFTLRAVDAASNTNSRAFSFTAQGPQVESFASSGTFTVPAGLTSVDVLVVGGGGAGGAAGSSSTSGGGGGAGGLIFMPAFPVSTGTITVTVGCGAGTNTSTHGAGPNGQPSAFGSPGDPGLGCGGVLTALGGGGGGAYSGCGPATGGSGGGGGSNSTSGRPGIQPTQPGNSGAYGFGNPGGDGQPYSNPAEPASGGGGGAGAAGSNQPCGVGGIGRAYTIADGTTPVYYAGGGGGGDNGTQLGGQGGGGRNGQFPSGAGTAGQANKGGGGGGAAETNTQPQTNGGAGGKGIVIVSY
ncbi:hypothetical protein N9C63_00300 [bacterium]|nr:hypothetical protein [bacterium]MDA9881781.1 hypothetical protein [Crocinitomicaceae bacterium]